MYIKTQNDMISEYSASCALALRDNEGDFSEEECRKHLSNIHAFLLHKMEHFKEDEFVLDETAEAQLSLIFRSLLRSKHNVQDSGL